MDKKFLIKILNDLINIGFSYSRIARCIGVTPSAIQKLIANKDRLPKSTTLIRILELYEKTFSGGIKGMPIQWMKIYYAENIWVINKNLEEIKIIKARINKFDIYFQHDLIS